MPKPAVAVPKATTCPQVPEFPGMQNAQARNSRRLPIGAEPTASGQTNFRVWAPKARQVEVAVYPEGHPEVSPTVHALAVEADGYHSGDVSVGPGTLYQYRLDGAEHSFPDPASRFQPHGTHGPSCVVEIDAFPWTDAAWRGLPLKGQIIYELHVGTFTPEGTWAAAAEQLAELAELGVTVIEMMPVNEFPGSHGWGYDGVDLFAPEHAYGKPDDLRAFIDRAHALKMAVILDVVYNHFGPEGNYLRAYAEHYFTAHHKCDWGEAINFDDADSGPVREFFISNARYWVSEFHFDGFRFDATQAIFDDSPEHILAAITRASREAANGRELIFLAENEPQTTKIVRPYADGGDGMSALWNDDFHHSARVALTGRNEGYYMDYFGTPQEFISAAKYGYLYQGQKYLWHKHRRGTPSFGLPPEAFVAFIENHDQVANTDNGQRLRFRTSPGRWRAMTALLLLGPWTPMLFQGQEFGASADFLYFNDVGWDLHDGVRRGRGQSLADFPSYASVETQAQLADPFAPETFQRCILDFSERRKHAGLYQLHRDLLRLRREEKAFAAQRSLGVDGAVLGPQSFVLRFFGEQPGGMDDRLLVVNFGTMLNLQPAPEPLLAPPLACEWQTVWSSELPVYGGPGAVPVEKEGAWRIPAEAATVLCPASLI